MSPDNAGGFSAPDSTGTPSAVQRMVDATNAGDTEAFLASFTADAYVEDWGRGFTGRDEIASWNQTDNIGKRAHFEVLKSTGTAPHYVVTLKVTGGGYNGAGDIEFETAGNLIKRMIISAD
jgi:hypothetical protein